MLLATWLVNHLLLFAVSLKVFRVHNEGHVEVKQSVVVTSQVVYLLGKQDGFVKADLSLAAMADL